MGYRILNSNKQPIVFSILNKEVANMWDKQFNPHIGTKPFPTLDTMYSSLFEGEIWADKLLYLTEKYGSTNWDELHTDLLLDLNIKAGKDNELYDSSIKYNKPYFDLIDQFQANYIFECVPDTLNETKV